MEYFLFSQDKAMNHVVSLDYRYLPKQLKPDIEIKLTTDIRWSDQAVFEQCYNFRVISKDSNMYPDYLYQPLPLLSTRMKEIFEAYEQYFSSTASFLSDPVLKIQEIYWLFAVREQDCLDESTELFPNRLLKKMVLNKKKIGTRQIFVVDGILEKRLVVSLDVAESLLRRSMEGIVLTPVTVV